MFHLVLMRDGRADGPAFIAVLKVNACGGIHLECSGIDKNIQSTSNPHSAQYLHQSNI